MRQADGTTHYCYLLPDGSIAPTLRLHPGDLLILTLKNDLVDPDPAHPQHHTHGKSAAKDWVTF